MSARRSTRSAARPKPLTVVFVGGGSLRLLPILRGVFFHHPGVFNGGEIRLVDRDVARAETVGRLLQRTPEYASSPCRITWGPDLDRALDGADALYVTMAVGSPSVSIRSHRASMKYGFLSSDQISPTGSFLGLTAGPVLLDFARRMERLCPRAMMLIYANPVAVYSGLVNNHTRIRALGICGGFTNHRWDLTRLMGRDEYDDSYEVDVAGVNHLSFILRGTRRGKDLYALLGQHLSRPFTPPRIHPEHRRLEPYIHDALKRLVWMYHRFGTIIFSTEGDGLAHLFFEDMLAQDRRAYTPPGDAAIRRADAAGKRRREEMDLKFRSHLDRDLDAAFWASPALKQPWFARNDYDVTLPILSALAGLGPERIVASAPHRGAVAGFKDRVVLEYSQQLDASGTQPAPNLEVPDVFHGLITGLATHQTLIGDAVATRDPRLLADALFAYPIHYHTREARALYRELLTIHRKEIPAHFQKTRDYL